jgi:ribosome biogenesis protein NSA1
VWVLCIDYYDENKIAVGTGHKQVKQVARIVRSCKLFRSTCSVSQLRIYDTKGGVRKPVVNLVYSDYPVTALRVCPSNSNHIIVGNTHGDMEMIDMRILKPCKKYKNIHGTIKSIEIMDNCVATCGLDRFLRVYNADTSDISSKIYLKSRLNCVLYSKHEPIVNRKSKPKTNDNDQDDILSDINSEDFGTDQLWSDIEKITDEHPEVFKKKKKDPIDGFAFKKPK